MSIAKDFFPQWRYLRSGICFHLAAIALSLLHVSVALAQYDRDGRYVPSPMGQPSDPYRSYIPGYTGKPGAAKGISTIPPAYQLKPAPLPKFLPRQGPPVRAASDLPVVFPTLDECRAGWSKNLGIPRARFKRQCDALLSAPKQRQ